MNKEAFHLIGIGGIGMSALARILLQKGYAVQGSDQKLSPMIEALRKEGASIEIGSEGHNLDHCRVVYSSAIKENHQELIRAQKQQLSLLHRSDLLNELQWQKKSLLVAGTHGKTTTSALLAWSLETAQMDPSFALGGIPTSLGIHGKHGAGDFFVIESDESDGSFLKTEGFGAIVTNCELEHLDFWKTEANLLHGFQTFFSQVKEQNHLFWCYDDPQLRLFSSPGFSYGFMDGADLKVSHFTQGPDGICFQVHFLGQSYEAIELSLLGKHNALNGAAVFGLLLTLGVDEKVIRNAFCSFLGIQRRLEKKGDVQGVLGFDDYAHHPTEVKATLSALRAAVQERRILAIVQPHRASRTKQLWKAWQTCFTDADAVIFTDIYLAGETAIDGVEIEKLVQEMDHPHVTYVPRERLEETLGSLLQIDDVFITLGAGDLTDASDGIFAHYRKRHCKQKIALLCGGTSVEHPITLLSARNIKKNFDPELHQVQVFYVTRKGQYLLVDDVPEVEMQSEGPRLSLDVFQALLDCDLAFPLFHGPQGEDGMIQGFLETLGIPYVGCDYQSAAICMQKSWSKQIVEKQGIAIAPFIEMHHTQYFEDPAKFEALVCQHLPFPMYVKACRLGSSLGVSRVSNIEELHRAAKEAFSLDEDLIVEGEIKGREVEFAVLGHEHLEVAIPSVLLTGGAFYDYERKYGANSVQLEIPAQITEEKKREGMEIAKKVFRSLGCKGLARIDFFLDAEGTFWFNEINPMPGFTEISAYPKMWQAAHMTQQTLLRRLISCALAKARGSRRESR